MDFNRLRNRKSRRVPEPKKRKKKKELKTLFSIYLFVYLHLDPDLGKMHRIKIVRMKTCLVEIYCQLNHYIMISKVLLEFFFDAVVI